MISVIVTAYNVEFYIKRAIESALSQDADVEIIAVDDHSADGTWNAITSIQDPRVKPLRLPENGGPSVARNAGIALAGGEWIVVLDGDDAFAPGRLARCLAAANDTDIIVDNLIVVRETDGAEFPMFNRLPPIDAATFINGRADANGNYTLGYLKPLFRRAFLIQHKLAYDPALRIGEDYRLLLEALLSGARCRVVQTAGYRYTARKHSISYRLTGADITRMLQADAQIIARYTLDAQAAAAQSRRTSWLVRERAYSQMVEAIKQKDWFGALKAVASCPSCAALLERPVRVRLQRWFSHA